MVNKKQIPLNLIFDYPVHWSKYKVLRDFIQNFYDSVPFNEFNDRFNYELTKKGELIFTISNVGFNYKWLIHIGASSKREESEKYAGYFGEGFKIAALCAIRDYNWNVTMSSSDWSLDVITSDMKIDKKSLTSLAYNVSVSETLSTDTTLKIYPFSENDYNIFLSALYTFYYKENPLIGDMLWENSNSAICFRSNLEKPVDLPISYDNKGDGIVFGSYQALGSFDLPFIFCLHDYKQEDRDRNNFSKIDVINILVGVIRYIPASIAAVLLNAFKKYWYSYPTEKYGYKSYYTVVKNLIMRVYTDSSISKLFLNENPNLLVAYKLMHNDIIAKNNRRQAISWFRNQSIEYTLVQDTFKLLGYATLEEECKSHNGFTMIRLPNSLEKNYIELLESFVKYTFAEFLDTSSLPECNIITNNTASWAGMAKCLKLTTPCIMMM